MVGRSLVAGALGQTDEQDAFAARAIAVLQGQRLEGVDRELPIALGAALDAVQTSRSTAA